MLLIINIENMLKIIACQLLSIHTSEAFWTIPMIGIFLDTQ